ncbi:MAG TPA: hypothetical protein VKR53_07035 [Puia sp.]|nr:hypothetical protein [Puia sp.]
MSSSQLEQFINDNRDEFDAEVPAKKIWDNIQQKLEPEVKKETRVVRLNFMRWSAAASIVVLLGAGAWYFLSDHGDVKPNGNITTVAKNQPATKEQTAKAIVGLPKSDSAARSNQHQLAKGNPKSDNINRNGVDGGFDLKTDEQKEMVYYAKIVELKHDELKKIKKDEPLLYKQFSGDVYKLDSVYQSLKKELPKNPNREQLLEAMIQNLQLQMELLNRQLHIIKQINNSKKSAYEQAYKSA